MPTGVYKRKPEDIQNRARKMKEAWASGRMQGARGMTPWNKGKKGLQLKSEETINKLKKSLKEHYSKHDHWIKNAKPEERPSWKGGRMFHSSGYILVYSLNHPYKDSRGYVFEHRLIMEKHLGRYLNSEEIIHHIDSNKTNNQIENLYLFENNGKHMVYHRSLRAMVEKELL